MLSLIAILGRHDITSREKHCLGVDHDDDNSDGDEEGDNGMEDVEAEDGDGEDGDESEVAAEDGVSSHFYDEISRKSCCK